MIRWRDERIQTSLVTPELQAWLDKWLPTALPNIFGLPISPLSNRVQSRSGIKAAVNVPVPNYSWFPPDAKVNTLYWPSGASRFGFYLALIADEYIQGYSAISDALEAGTLTLEDKTHNERLAVEMYAMPAHCLTAVEGPVTPQMWLLPLVDRRYWWQFHNTGSLVVTKHTTWRQLRTQIGESLSTTIYVPPDISSAYMNPDPEEFTRRFESVPAILDATAHSLGCRITSSTDRTFEGQVKVASFGKDYRYAPLKHENPAYDPEKMYTDNVDFFKERAVAGGKKTTYNQPQYFLVTFPRYNGDEPLPEFADKDGRLYTHQVDITDSGAVRSTSGTKVIHDTAAALYPSETSDEPSDKSLKRLAKKLAEDYVASLFGYDITYAGLAAWTPLPYDDWTEWSVGELLPDGTHRATTRVRSVPVNFGVEEMLHQLAEKCWKLTNCADENDILFVRQDLTYADERVISVTVDDETKCYEVEEADASDEEDTDWEACLEENVDDDVEVLDDFDDCDQCSHCYHLQNCWDEFDELHTRTNLAKLYAEKRGLDDTDPQYLVDNLIVFRINGRCYKVIAWDEDCEEAEEVEAEAEEVYDECDNCGCFELTECDSESPNIIWASHSINEDGDSIDLSDYEDKFVRLDADKKCYSVTKHEDSTCSDNTPLEEVTVVESYETCEECICLTLSDCKGLAQDIVTHTDLYGMGLEEGDIIKLTGEDAPCWEIMGEAECGEDSKTVELDPSTLSDSDDAPDSSDQSTGIGTLPDDGASDPMAPAAPVQDVQKFESCDDCVGETKYTLTSSCSHGECEEGEDDPEEIISQDTQLAEYVDKYAKLNGRCYKVERATGDPEVTSDDALDLQGPFKTCDACLTATVSQKIKRYGQVFIKTVGSAPQLWQKVSYDIFDKGLLIGTCKGDDEEVADGEECDAESSSSLAASMSPGLISDTPEQGGSGASPDQLASLNAGTGTPPETGGYA